MQFVVDEQRFPFCSQVLFICWLVSHLQIEFGTDRSGYNLLASKVNSKEMEVSVRSV